MRYEFTFQPKPFQRTWEFDTSPGFNSGLVAQEWQYKNES
jgi:hypothetical protein